MSIDFTPGVINTYNGEILEFYSKYRRDMYLLYLG